MTTRVAPDAGAPAPSAAPSAAPTQRRVDVASPDAGDRRAHDHPGTAPSWADAALLAVVVLLSTTPYLAGMGFYSDDWDFLSQFALRGDQSLRGVLHNVAGNRPAQSAYLYLLYWAFGLQPLGHHLVNAGVLALTVVLLYLVLRELRQPRLFALAAAAVYGLLPHYSADRFWYVAFQAPLSIALYLTSLYADLRARRGRPLPWKALAVASLVVSVLLYEVAVPLFLLNAVIVWREGRRARVGGRDATRSWLEPLATIAALALVVAYKAANTTRIGNRGGWAAHFRDIARRAVDPQHSWLLDYGFNVRSALTVNFGHHGVLLPREAWRALTRHAAPSVAIVAAAIGALLFWYLRRLPALDWTRRRLLAAVAAGAALFWLGYSIFLTNFNVTYSPTGFANRTAIAAALGVALVYAGGAGLAASLLPARLRHAGFCAAIALLCAAGSAVVGAVGGYWQAAFATQRAVVADIARALPSPPAPGSALLLDGVCSYHGPAPIFESSWDLAGALALQYRRRGVRADVVSHLTRIDDDSLRLWHYGASHAYPYSPRTLVYRLGSGEAVPLSSAAAARAYFDRVNPDRTSGCPWFVTGHGTSIL